MGKSLDGDDGRVSAVTCQRAVEAPRTGRGGAGRILAEDVAVAGESDGIGWLAGSLRQLPRADAQLPWTDPELSRADSELLEAETEGLGVGPGSSGIGARRAATQA